MKGVKGISPHSHALPVSAYSEDVQLTKTEGDDITVKLGKLKLRA